MLSTIDSWLISTIKLAKAELNRNWPLSTKTVSVALILLFLRFESDASLSKLGPTNINLQKKKHCIFEHKKECAYFYLYKFDTSSSLLFELFF